MSDVKPWAKALKISHKDYEEWTTHVPKGESLTFWALEKGRLKPQEYLFWAREHYQLPVLKDQFFKTHLNHELWSQIQSVANWSPHLLPLYQWDGIIYVGCVEPPKDVVWSFPVVYVLASARSLKTYWENLQSSAPQPNITNESTSPKAPTKETSDTHDHLANIQIPPIETPKIASPPGESSEVSPAIESIEPTPQPDNNQPIEVPDGLNLNLPTLKDDGPYDTSVDAKKDSTIPDAPEGIQLENIDFKLDLPEEPLLTQESTIEPELDKVTIPDSAPEDFSSQKSKPSLEVNDSPIEDRPSDFKLKFDLKEGSPDDDPTFGGNTVTKFAITVSGINKKAPQGAVIDTENMAPHSSDSAANDTEVSAWLFNELRQFFKQSMILLKDQDKLKPWKWENNWQPSSESAFESFSPDQPGLFRILMKTKHPYHGYVVESDLNKSFFKFWGYETLPDHVTAIPMKMDGQVTGVILSIGSESAATESTLIHSERLAQEFISRIVEISSQAA